LKLKNRYKRVEIQEKPKRVGKDQFLQPVRVKLTFSVPEMTGEETLSGITQNSFGRARIILVRLFLPVIVGGQILTNSADFNQYSMMFGYAFHSRNFDEVRRLARTPHF
jgi:hypothetical protein